MPRLLNRVAATASIPAIAASVAFVLLTVPGRAQPLTIQTVSAVQALKIANAAIAKCSQPGPRITISVAVIDQAGNPRLLLNADTASLHNLELARRKAYTARTFRVPSSEWAKKSAGDSPLAGQRQLANVIPLGGGMPITMRGETIGGVGISGATGGQPEEEACARAAIDAIASELQ